MPERNDAPSRRWPLALVLAALITAAWYPFRPGFEGPRRVENGARLEAGVLHLEGAPVARTPGPTDWVADARAHGGLELRLDVRSTRADQTGPARILTVSSGWYSRNVTLAQRGPDLVARVRRPGSTPDGTPPLVARDVFAEPDRWHALGLCVDAATGAVELEVDGEVADRAEAAGGARDGAATLAGWDPSFRLAFGDELTGARPFEGAVRGATAVVGDEVFDLLQPARLDLPARVWDVPERARRLLELDDSRVAWYTAWHAATFSLLGAALALAARRIAPARLALRAALVAAPVSVVLELGKLLFADRHPSLPHLVPDALGAALGAFLFARFRR